MDIDFDLLKRICETPGVPGYEGRIRELVKREVEPLADEVRVDNMGNLCGFRKGTGDKKAMVGAHMDEIGFMVNHIDDKGYLRFTTLGGFDPKSLTAQRVIVHGSEDLVGVMGTKPIHVMEEEERKKLPKTKDFFIDLGMSREEVEKKVHIGAPVSRERELIQMGGCVNGKSIDNRISVYILIETLKKLKEHPPAHDLYAVFTVQEEVGIRGASVSSLEIQPDFGFGLDTTLAFDGPGSQAHEQVTELGKGAAIKVLDASAICDPRMVAYLKKVADGHEIPWQSEVLTAGGTDTKGIQQMKAGGAISGAVSIPTRYLHQVIESADKQDISHCIELLTQGLLELDRFEAGSSG
ncbi:MAG: M42 family metallopeptidase [Flavobacteriales bacterium]